MKAKKILKALVAAAMLTAVTAAFFGAPTSLACRIQPAATITFLIVLLITPLFGRLFCECFCPLGIIQSFVNWMFHSKTKVRRMAFMIRMWPTSLSLKSWRMKFWLSSEMRIWQVSIPINLIFPCW